MTSAFVLNILPTNDLYSIFGGGKKCGKGVWAAINKIGTEPT